MLLLLSDNREQYTKGLPHKGRCGCPLVCRNTLWWQVIVHTVSIHPKAAGVNHPMAGVCTGSCGSPLPPVNGYNTHSLNRDPSKIHGKRAAIDRYILVSAQYHKAWVVLLVSTTFRAMTQATVTATSMPHAIKAYRVSLFSKIFVMGALASLAVVCSA